MTVTFSPTKTPSARASSLPRTMLNESADSVSRLPSFMCVRKSTTLSSRSGTMPRTIAPRTDCPKESMPCACTKGAAARTPGWLADCSATCCQSAISPFAPVICTCETTARMRPRNSVWKPFITDSTTISAATPSAMPSIEIIEMKEMK
jgi:hypothetical protein